MLVASIPSGCEIGSIDAPEVSRALAHRLHAEIPIGIKRHGWAAFENTMRTELEFRSTVGARAIQVDRQRGYEENPIRAKTRRMNYAIIYFAERRRRHA